MRDADGNRSRTDSTSFSAGGSVELQRLDIPDSLAADIMLRRLYLKGQGDLQSLSQSLKLAFPLMSACFRNCAAAVFRVIGMVGNNYSFTLTDAGRDLAEKTP